MSERTQNMARMYVEQGMTYQQIADEFGITRQRVHQLLAPLKLAVHEGQARKAVRIALLTEAYGRIIARETTLQEEAEHLGYASEETLRTALRKLGMLVHLPQPEPEHGTLNRYRRGCHCEECREAVAERQRSRYGSVEPPHHGTVSGYQNYGCMCKACREAGRVYQRNQRAARHHRREVITQ